MASLSADPAAESAIRQLLDDEVNAWNSGDAVAFSKGFAADGTFTNIVGQFMVGYEGFLRQHEFVFRTLFMGTSLQQEITALQFAEPDVAIVETLTAVTGLTQPPPGALFDAAGSLRTRLLQVLVRRGDHWEIVAYHNVAVNPNVPTPAR